MYVCYIRTCVIYVHVYNTCSYIRTCSYICTCTCTYTCVCTSQTSIVRTYVHVCVLWVYVATVTYVQCSSTLSQTHTRTHSLSLSLSLSHTHTHTSTQMASFAQAPTNLKHQILKTRVQDLSSDTDESVINRITGTVPIRYKVHVP